MVDGISFGGDKPKYDPSKQQGNNNQYDQGETFEMFGKKYRALPPLTTPNGATLGVYRFVEDSGNSLFTYLPPGAHEQPAEEFPGLGLSKEKEPEKDLSEFQGIKLPHEPKEKTPIEVPKEIVRPENKEPSKDLPKFPDIKNPESEDPKDAVPAKPDAEEKPKDKKVGGDSESVTNGAFSKDYAQGLINTYGHAADYSETTSSKGYPRYVNKNTGEIIGQSLYKQLCMAEEKLST